MSLIALDLSITRTGVAKFKDSGELETYFSIAPSDNLKNFHKIQFIVNELKPHFTNVDQIIVEGIFLGVFGRFPQVTGFELLARLSGAVINEWLNTKEFYPILLKATETRKYVGVKGTCQKAEVQCWVARKFGYATEDQLHTFESMIEAEKAALQEGEMTKATWKKHMDQICKYIEGEIGLNEDCADAILTGLAFIEAKKQGKI
jgi:hypothetical protein